MAALPAKASSARSRVRELERTAARHRPRKPADPARLRAAGIAVEFA